MKVALNADDTKLYRNVLSTEHCDLIPDTLSNMHVWPQGNNIRFNTSQCKVLTVTRKKTHTLDGTALTRVSEEKDLGVIITSTLSWDSHIHTITAKANKLLGLLKRTCPLLSSDESSYKDRLILLDLLPLSLDCELKDLIFFYKCLYCSTDLDVRNYVSFVSHDRTRLSNSFNLRTPFCKTSSFQASYFNRIVKLWNYVCKLAPPTSFSSPTAFQLFVRKLMSTHLSRVYEINYPCTWTLVHTSPCHS